MVLSGLPEPLCRASARSRSVGDGKYRAASPNAR